MSSHSENKEKKLASIQRRSDFLKLFEITEDVGKFVKDEELINALRSQTSWAKFSRGDEFISMSLNSFKSHCEQALLGGFSALDALRENALKSVEEYEREKNRKTREVRADTRQGLNRKVVELEKQLLNVRASNLMLSKAIEVTLEVLGSLADSSREQKVLNIIESERNRIDILLKKSFKLDKP
ncbi:hypothetical protein AB6T38_11025 [Aliiglaciecola sp. SL4]|uniref:hypothetical protein n=1 Tax=Aliiglaciecola sp. SL4 TaxID=3239806 RepID=UPI00355BFBD7